jgi:hypothetical protein
VATWDYARQAKKQLGAASSELVWYEQEVDATSFKHTHHGAGVAQLVEQLICNQQVAGSSPIVSSNSALESMMCLRVGKMKAHVNDGGVPKRSTGADCKSAAFMLRRFESFPLHQIRGSSSVGRASAFQAEGRGFEPRFPLQFFKLNTRCGQSKF